MPDTKQEQSAFEKLIADPHKAGCAICGYLVCHELRAKCRVWDAALQAACEAVCHLCAEHKPVFQPKDDNADHCGFQHHWDSGSAHHVYTCFATRIRALLSKPEGK